MNPSAAFSMSEFKAAFDAVISLSKSADDAWRALELGCERSASAGQLLQPLTDYQQRRAAYLQAQGGLYDAMRRLLADLRQTDPATTPDCTERLALAIELHSDETSNELSRAADALERIADSVEGVAALFAQVAKDESASLKATRETTIEAANAFMAAITQSDAAP